MTQAAGTHRQLGRRQAVLARRSEWAVGKLSLPSGGPGQTMGSIGFVWVRFLDPDPLFSIS
jgi:hypothetical protein